MRAHRGGNTSGATVPSLRNTQPDSRKLFKRAPNIPQVLALEQTGKAGTGGKGGEGWGNEQKARSRGPGLFQDNPGNFLLSHTLTRAVPSGLRGLTAVFGMGTGGSLSLRSPRKQRGQ